MSVTSMIAAAARTSMPRRTPRAISQPPPRFPGMLTSTIAAVSIDAAAALPPRSSTTKVGSQIITEVHWAV